MPDQMSGAAAAGATLGSVIVVSGPAGVGKSTVSRLVAEEFGRSVHLRVDDVMQWIVSGWIDPHLPEAAEQNEAIGGAVAVSSMGLARRGYVTVVDGNLFPEGVAVLADTCAGRGLSCHFAVLRADLTTCWDRASSRPLDQRPVDAASFERLHARYAALALDERHLIDATAPAPSVCTTVLTALEAGQLTLTS